MKTDDYSLYLSMTAPVAQLTTAQLDDGRRVCGANKLHIRRIWGWESPDARAMLRQYNARLDVINDEDARRQHESSRRIAMKRVGAMAGTTTN